MVFGERKGRRANALIAAVGLMTGIDAVMIGGCGPSPEVRAAQKAEDEYEERFTAVMQKFSTSYLSIFGGLSSRQSFDTISLKMAENFFQCVRDLDALPPPAKYAEVHREMRTLMALIGSHMRDSTYTRKNGNRAAVDRVDAWYEPRIDAAFVRVKAAIERGRAAERNRQGDFWEKVGQAGRVNR
jgi:hypothetical protein